MIYIVVVVINFTTIRNALKKCGTIRNDIRYQKNHRYQYYHQQQIKSVQLINAIVYLGVRKRAIMLSHAKKCDNVVTSLSSSYLHYENRRRRFHHFHFHHYYYHHHRHRRRRRRPYSLLNYQQQLINGGGGGVGVGGAFYQSQQEDQFISQKNSRSYLLNNHYKLKYSLKGCCTINFPLKNRFKLRNLIEKQYREKKKLQQRQQQQQQQQLRQRRQERQRQKFHLENLRQEQKLQQFYTSPSTSRPSFNFFQSPNITTYNIIGGLSARKLHYDKQNYHHHCLHHYHYHHYHYHCHHHHHHHCHYHHHYLHQCSDLRTRTTTNLTATQALTYFKRNYSSILIYYWHAVSILACLFATGFCLNPPSSSSIIPISSSPSSLNEIIYSNTSSNMYSCPARQNPLLRISRKAALKKSAMSYLLTSITIHELCSMRPLKRYEYFNKIYLFPYEINNNVRLSQLFLFNEKEILDENDIITKHLAYHARSCVISTNLTICKNCFAQVMIFFPLILHPTYGLVSSTSKLRYHLHKIYI